MGESVYQQRSTDILSWILASLLVLVCLWVGRLTGVVEQQNERLREQSAVMSEWHAYTTVLVRKMEVHGIEDIPPLPSRTAQGERNE